MISRNKLKDIKILLIVPKYSLTDKKNYNYNFPLGLAYISSVLKKENYDVDFLNLNHFDGKIEEIINRFLTLKKYDIIGTGGNALIYSVLEKIIISVRNYSSNIKIILGGPIITSEPELIFTSLKPDIGVIGEGERTIIDILKTFKNKKDLKEVAGIIYKNSEEKIIKTKSRELILNLDSIPFPDVEGVGISEQLNHMYCNEHWKNAFDYPRTYYILGSRSCPFQCTFCYHDSRYRARSINNLIEEIKINIDKYNINNFLIYDECFATDQKKIYAFCKEMRKIQKETSKEIRWLCQLRVNYVDEKLLKEMKEAGCDVISYGFESYSQIVLNSMKKNITPEQIDKAFNMTIKAKINVQANFILGDVAETKETAKETLDYFEKYGRGQLGLGFIQPYPNSQIYQHCVQKGIIKNKLDFIKDLSADNWYNMTNKMTDEEINQLKQKILELTSKHVVYITPFSVEKMKKNTYSFKVKCPFCKEEITYQNCFVKNIFNYGFQVVCRNCHMRFFILSSFQKIAYKYYPLSRRFRDLQKRVFRQISKQKI